MRVRIRLSIAVALVSLAAAGVTACVGDNSSGQDASTPDATSPNDATAPPDAPADVSTDAGPTDAESAFDGQNAYCNDIDPSQAPALSTIECASPTVTASGGTIPPGRYYLFDESFLPTSPECKDAGLPTPYGDVVQIEAADGGGAYTVNAGLGGSGAKRLTFGWAITDAGYFAQSDVCPSDSHVFSPVAYNVSVSGSTTTIQYELLGLAVVTLKSF